MAHICNIYTFISQCGLIIIEILILIYNSDNFDFIFHNCDFISCTDLNLTISIILYITTLLYILYISLFNWVKIFKSVFISHNCYLIIWNYLTITFF